MKMGIDWSELQPELLEIIASKLKIYIDYVRFRAVCVKWRSSASPTPHHLPTQLPWLMMPFFGSPDGTHCSFFDLSENKFHYSILLECEQSRCCGSSQGWLVFVEEYSPSIRLVNPLTQNVIHLPPVTTFPNVLDFNISKSGKEYLTSDGGGHRRSMKYMRDNFINKVVLSSSPNSLENDYIALVILNEIAGLAFHKKGAEEWSIIEDARYYYEDAIYYNGSFYAINEAGSVSICDLSGVSPIVTLLTVTAPPKSGYGIAYLVDSFGELMLITRYMKLVDDLDHDSEYDLGYETVYFSVFKYDSIEPEWVQMDTLGDHMLFLGENSSVCLSTSDFSGCERNCIYFSSEETDLMGNPDFGVYHLDDSSIVPLAYGHDSLRYMLLPIWVTPNPC